MAYANRLKVLQELLEAGAITPEDYENARLALLGREGFYGNASELGATADVSKAQNSKPERPGGSRRIRIIVGLTVVCVIAVVACVAIGFSNAATGIGASGASTSTGDSATMAANTNNSADADADASTVATEQKARNDKEPMEIYAPVIQAYSELTHTSEKLSNGGDRYINPAMRAAPYLYPGGVPSYALIDLANDGSPELIIAMKYESGGNGDGTSGSAASYRILDMYGYFEDGSQPVRLDMSGYRYDDESSYSTYYFLEEDDYTDVACYLCEGGLVCTSNKRDIRIADTCYWWMPKDDVFLQIKEWVRGMGSDLTLQSEDNYYDDEPIDVQTANDIYSSHPVLENIDWVALG